MYFSAHDEERGKKIISILAVILLHALVVYALMNWSGKHIVTVKKQLPVEVMLIEATRPPLPAQPVASIAPSAQPKPQRRPKPVMPLPEVQTEKAPAQEVMQDITNVQQQEPATLPGQSSAQPVAPANEAVAQATSPAVVRPGVDFSTCSKPDYPRNSLRNEEHGTVRIQFLIGTDGRVADSKIEKSSGYRMLDMAAKNALSKCQFKPGTINGVPQQSWTVVDYVWKLPE